MKIIHNRIKDDKKLSNEILRLYNNCLFEDTNVFLFELNKLLKNKKFIKTYTIDCSKYYNDPSEVVVFLTKQNNKDYKIRLERSNAI